MKALAFDVYGTLLDFTRLEEPLRAVTADPTAFSATWRSKQLEYSFLLTIVNRHVPWNEVTRRALRWTASRFHVPLDTSREAELVARWNELPAYADVRPALEKLRARRVPLVVLSNGDPAMLEAGTTHAGLRPYFSELISVESVGTFKPSKAVYELAARRLKLGLQDVGLVSANPFDALGAKAAGLRAIWLNRSGATFDPLDLAPDFELHSFGEIPELPELEPA